MLGSEIIRFGRWRLRSWLCDRDTICCMKEKRDGEGEGRCSGDIRVERGEGM
jgi:hypothetical protein